METGRLLNITLKEMPKSYFSIQHVGLRLLASSRTVALVITHSGGYIPTNNGEN